VKKVLIVSPHFPPVNAPDMQRARLALPYLRDLGWEATVLAVDPAGVEGAITEPLLEETYPAEIRVIRVKGIPPRWTRWAGVGSLWWRCGSALRRAGDRLLSLEKFDLVFFSTTQFDCFTLGPRWLRRHGVPYALDYQDPWVNDYYRHTGTRPPGGSLKYWFSQYTACRREPEALLGAAAVITVSSAYGPGLLARYPSADAARIHHLPFGSSLHDFATARRHRPARGLVAFGDGLVHQIYAGRCGPDMSRSLTLLFRAFRLYRDSHPGEARLLRFHFIGTDYAPPPLGRYWALPIAEKEGVADSVAEHCYRVPYFDALHYLLNADALLAVGSNDHTYSASKIFPYLMAHRPLLTLVHKDSIMLKLVREHGFSTSHGFDNDMDPDAVDEIVKSIHADWFVARAWRREPKGAPDILRQYTAEGMSAALADIFDGAVRR
jgi:hypothetical protein